MCNDFLKHNNINTSVVIIHTLSHINNYIFSYFSPRTYIACFQTDCLLFFMFFALLLL